MSGPERTVLISGGTRGLGAGLVDAFLRGGDRVARFGRTRTDRVQQWESSPETKDRFRFEEVDATDSGACRDFARRIANDLGPIRVLVNNAGMALEGLLPLFSDAQVDRLLELN